MKLYKILIAVAVLALLVGAVAVSMRATPAAQADSPKNNILARALDVELGRAQPRAHEQKLSSGVIYALLAESGELDRRADAAKAAPGQLNPPASATGGCPNKYVGGGTSGGSNTRVNQDCSLRRQAEEVIAINPTNPNNLIAGQNDSRLGFNKCGYDWSFDGGKTWGDQIPPFYQFVNPDGVTFDACSDPTATFDSQGNAYVGGVLFEINYADSAFVVAKSNAGIGGAFYHTPAALSFQTYRDVPLGVVANDNDPNIFNDKEFIVSDASTTSPKKNNVYGTWTRFANTTFGVGFNSPIYFSQSTDGGATWSKGIEISGANAAACTAFSGEANPNACDQDQGSHPIVGTDGTIYVSFNNYNVNGFGIAQQLVVKCPADKDCSQAASWTSPVKIADDIATQPFGPSATSGCPGGRQCLPPNGYRMNDFGALSVDNSGKLFFTWSDFRNGGGACPALGDAATIPGGCDNDVFYSYSNDGGATWSAPFNVTPKAKFGATAQWQAWGAVTPDGKTFFVGYYDRSYGNCEFDGCNDITVAAIDNAASASPSVKYTRLTTSSMPNLTTGNNPIQAGFLGDYMWVATDAKGKAYVVWADTRGLGGTVEEDIYFGTLP
jgi:hypothetical protein